MSATLAYIADELEQDAGASTTANPNEAGYWKRIAAAVETLAGASTSANENIQGYMLRAALAAEAISETSGAEENATEAGYLRRIAEAFEVETGAGVGSWLERIRAGAEDYAGVGPPVTLAALSLDDLTIAEDQPVGTKVGTITGATSGSTVTLNAQSNANMFAKDGNDIEVGAAGLDFETVPSPTITLRETHSNATNSPRDTVIAISVTDVSGPELLTNGDMSSETGWTLSPEDGLLTIAGGTMNVVAGDDPASASQTPAITEGSVYKVTGTASALTGTITINVGNGVTEEVTSSGAFSLNLTAGPDDLFNMVFASATTATLDNLSLKEVL